MPKAVVLVKQVPDTEEVRIDPKTREPDTTRARRVLSLYDKNAVEAAVKLKEAKKVDRVVAIALGDEKVDETLREVLAMGVDEGVSIKDAKLLTGGSLGKSRALAKAIEKVGDVAIVIAAEESADSHTASTGPMVSEFLLWPLLSYCSKIEMGAGDITVEREIDEGVETLKAPLPAVVTVVESINEPRLPALMQILQAKNKPITPMTAADLGVEVKASITRTGNVAPEATRKKQIKEVSNADEAARWLIDSMKKEGVLS